MVSQRDITIIIVQNLKECPNLLQFDCSFNRKSFQPRSYFSQITLQRPENGSDKGDNESMYTGYCIDINRFASRDLLPLRDSVDNGDGLNRHFGGPHEVWNAVFCDGSTRGLSFDIDPLVHEEQANRYDEKL